MIKCYIDKHGRRTADVGMLPSNIKSFLEQDIQNDVDDCDKIIRTIDEIRLGNCKKWEGTGNAHSIVITDKNVVIENNFDGNSPRSIISLADLRECMNDWKLFLEGQSEH